MRFTTLCALALTATLLTDSPVQATIIFDESGVADFGVSANINPNSGRYRITYTAASDKRGSYVIRLSEFWRYTDYYKGQIVGTGETIIESSPPGAEYKFPPGDYTAEFDLPDFRDFRDSQLSGTFVDVVGRGLVIDFLFYYEQPTPYRLLVERLGPVGGGQVPEPGTWGMMLGGLGLLGSAARRRRYVAAHT